MQDETQELANSSAEYEHQAVDGDPEASPETRDVQEASQKFLKMKEPNMQRSSQANGLRDGTTPGPVVDAGVQEVWWSAGVDASVKNYGASCSMSTLRPKVRTGDYSALVTAITNEDSSHPHQTIRAGWIRVGDADNLPVGDNQDLCQVFVHFTTSGDDVDDANQVQGWNETVTGWIPEPGAFRPGHNVLLASHINGTQGTLDLKFQLKGDKWILRMNGAIIGHYPTSLFTVDTRDPNRPPLPDTSATLADHATKVLFYGQVYDPTSDGMTWTDMGSGKYPDEGFGKSAFISKMQYQPFPTSRTVTMKDADDTWNHYSDDPMRYESRVAWKSNTTWRSYMYLGGPGCESVGWSSWESAGGFFKPGTPISSVSRTQTVVDLFVVGYDGRVYNSFWHDEDWSGFNHNWRPLTWSGSEKFVVGSKVAAVARSPDNLDIFAIGQDSKIYTAWWSTGRDWTGWRNISETTTFPNGFVTAISRKEGQLDVFVASEQRVWSSHWTDSVTDWTGRDKQWDETGIVFFTGDPHVTVVSRTPDTMEVFAATVGGITPGVLWNTWISGPGSAYGYWSGFQSLGVPPGLLVARVAAVVRTADRVDVFVIGDKIYTSYWNTSISIWSSIEDQWEDVSTAFPDDLYSHSDIAVVSRSPSCMDLFVSGLAGEIFTTSVDESIPDYSWSRWQSLGQKGFIGPAKFDLTALARNNQTMMVAGCGLDDTVWVVEWLDPICGPRPFYCMAHNPNALDATTDDALTVLNMGANALGPDVNRVEDSGKVVIHHGLPPRSPRDTDPDPVTYLQHLRVLADNNPHFTMVAFDCKDASYLWRDEDVGADLGLQLLTDIRTHLTAFVSLDIVICVAKRAGLSVFSKIHNILGPREAICVDQERDAYFVANHFNQLRATSNAMYGFGNTFQLPLPPFDPEIRPAIEQAVGMRTGFGSFQAVYEWTSDDVERIKEYIRIGADGVMSNFEYNTLFSIPLEDMVLLVKNDREMRREVRMATRKDRLLSSPKPGYLLAVDTGDTGAAGTDAKLTFVLRGEQGIAKKTVDASWTGRMEARGKDSVVLQCRDLGNLIDITVYNDMSRSFFGNSAWRCESITVVSKRYAVHSIAVFGVNITAAPVTRPFT